MEGAQESIVLRVTKRQLDALRRVQGEAPFAKVRDAGFGTFLRGTFPRSFDNFSLKKCIRSSTSIEISEFVKRSEKNLATIGETVKISSRSYKLTSLC